MKPKFREVLEMAIHDGVTCGYRRAFKYVENPHENAIMQSIEEKIMESIYEWFDFEEDDK